MIVYGKGDDEEGGFEASRFRVGFWILSISQLVGLGSTSGVVRVVSTDRGECGYVKVFMGQVQGVL